MYIYVFSIHPRMSLDSKNKILNFNDFFIQIPKLRLTFELRWLPEDRRTDSVHSVGDFRIKQT